MKILISNDDGYMAKGIRTLARSLAGLGEITVVAPDRNRSGASNSLTLENPLRLDRMEDGVYRVEGTPTDCVHLAITGLLEDEPDMVVSGINAGANLGDDVLYSGCRNGRTISGIARDCYFAGKLRRQTLRNSRLGGPTVSRKT